MKIPHRGVLLALEGIDGAGKTTQVHAVGAALAAAGLDVVSTKEPTNHTPHGRKIRASAASERLPLAEELHAFIEDRRVHVRDLIEPHLATGDVVVVDRYYYSSVAYQGARGAATARVLELNEAFAPRPDLLVILEVDPKIGMDRVRRRGATSTFELESELEAAARIFATIEGTHVLRLDGRAPISEITAAILERLLHGALRQRFCGQGDTQCDLPWCTEGEVGDCPWPTIAAALRPGGTGALDAIRAAVEKSQSDDEAISSVLAIVKGAAEA